MSGLEDYVVPNDNFKACENDNCIELSFPCNVCEWADEPETCEACRTCGHNVNAERSEA